MNEFNSFSSFKIKLPSNSSVNKSYFNNLDVKIRILIRGMPFALKSSTVISSPGETTFSSSLSLKTVTSLSKHSEHLFSSLSLSKCLPHITHFLASSLKVLFSEYSLYGVKLAFSNKIFASIFCLGFESCNSLSFELKSSLL